MQLKKKIPPTMSPTLGLVPFMAPNAIKEDFRRVYQMQGGAARLLEESQRDPDSYKWFIGLLVRMLPKELAVEHSGAKHEDYIDRLDALEREQKAKTINAEYVEVQDAIDQ